ncbi:MAG: hypothetical protein CM15mP84_03550 [Cellvibrionales bacterium]|nr:MAG: hypothetical protein CM15mP84_03550 [Cellvibrionales bacterium]
MPAPLQAQIVATPKSPMFGEPDQHQLGCSALLRTAIFAMARFAVSGGVIPDLRWSAISPMSRRGIKWCARVRDQAGHGVFCGAPDQGRYRCDPRLCHPAGMAGSRQWHASAPGGSKRALVQGLGFWWHGLASSLAASPFGRPPGSRDGDI